MSKEIDLSGTGVQGLRFMSFFCPMASIVVTCGLIIKSIADNDGDEFGLALLYGAGLILSGYLMRFLLQALATIAEAAKMYLHQTSEAENSDAPAAAKA